MNEVVDSFIKSFFSVELDPAYKISEPGETEVMDIVMKCIKRTSADCN